MFDEIWSSTATLASLSNWLSVAFATNSAYPVLVSFGHFAGSSVAEWAETQQSRILVGMAETPNFDAARFSSSINKLAARYAKTIYITNILSACWAVVAAVMLFYLILLASFQPTKIVAPSIAWFALLSFAVPVGLLAVLLSHISARAEMWYKTHEYDTVIKYSNQKIEETLGSAQQALNKVENKQAKPRARNNHAAKVKH